MKHGLNAIKMLPGWFEGGDFIVKTRKEKWTTIMSVLQHHDRQNRIYTSTNLEIIVTCLHMVKLKTVFKTVKSVTCQKLTFLVISSTRIQTSFL